MKDQAKNIKADNTVIDGQEAIDWSVLDALKVLQRPGKPDVQKWLIGSYLISAPPLLESATTAVKLSDGEALMMAAHTLKSSSLTIGAMAFGATCSELEQLGRADTLENASALLNRAENEFAAVCSSLRAALE